MATEHTYTVVGLGNPGPEYTHTRHNIGRLILESIAEHMGCDLDETGKHNAHVGMVMLGVRQFQFALPNTYMNKSGSSVRTFIKTSEDAERLVVVYDDLDLPWGTLRIAFGRGSGGHNGIESVAKALKTKNFIRIRVGIAPTDEAGTMRKPRGAEAVLKFVMGTFSKRELAELGPIAERVAEALRIIGVEGRQAAMNAVN